MRIATSLNGANTPLLLSAPRISVACPPQRAAALRTWPAAAVVLHQRCAPPHSMNSSPDNSSVGALRHGYSPKRFAARRASGVWRKEFLAMIADARPPRFCLLGRELRAAEPCTRGGHRSAGTGETHVKPSLM